MKKLFILLLSALSLTAVAQQKKTVAVLEPICRDKSVNAFFQQMVRGTMESAVTSSEEYEAYDRTAFDKIMQEQKFQRSGAVNDSQIKKMGEMAGVDYVLVSEVIAYEGNLYAVIKILNVTTGQYDKSIDDIMELSPNAVRNKCKELASSLFELPSSINMAPYSQDYSTNTTEASPDNLIIDLELSSFPKNANVEWRIVSKSKEVQSSIFRPLGTTYLEKSVKLDINGLTAYNAEYVYIQLRFSKSGHEPTIEDFDIKSLLDINSISYTAILEPIR